MGREAEEITTPPGSPRILIRTRQGRLQRSCAATKMAAGVLTPTNGGGLCLPMCRGHWLPPPRFILPTT